ncbi:MAG: GTPase Era [Defluviitaleaceae bacterium]|nr:GTPase Era [Defluviitaleaceae bacterium]
MTDFYSGFVTLIGRPNVGKSTLMNHFVGEKISIVTSKPQTTRNKIRSILTGEDYQIVFIDTPGIHTPTSKLGDFMVRSAVNAIGEADAVIYMVEPKKKIPAEDMAIIQRLTGSKKRAMTTPVFLAINKVDTIPKQDLLAIIDQYRQLYPFSDIIPLSALKGDNTVGLLNAIRGVLPKGPMYFPGDQITDQPERQITSEIVREKALTFLQEEVPHGMAIEITHFKLREGHDEENPDALVDIGANIFCEKDSHKAIIIGKQGAMLKRIGAAARRDIEALLGYRVYLELWVKVKKNWRDSDFMLKNFGYTPSSS